VRIATWNVNSLTARLPRVEEWIAYAQPDVLCLQETKQADAAFPHGAFAALGYETAHHGDGRWNGVAIVSRVGLSEVSAGLGSAEDTQGTRLIAADCGDERHQGSRRRQRPQAQQRTCRLGLLRRHGEIAVDRGPQQRAQVEGAADPN